MQVLIHDGNPRRSGREPELVWARIVGAEGDHFVAVCLNEPRAITSVHEGEQFRFRVAETAEYPFLVSDRYLMDRTMWAVATPCGNCGFDELFDPPSELASEFVRRSGGAGEVEVFTQFCPLCGGVQVVATRAVLDQMEQEDGGNQLSPDVGRRRFGVRRRRQGRT